LSDWREFIAWLEKWGEAWHLLQHSRRMKGWRRPKLRG